MIVQELIEKLQSLPNKNLRVCLLDPEYNNFYDPVVGEELTLHPDHGTELVAVVGGLMMTEHEVAPEEPADVWVEH